MSSTPYDPQYPGGPQPQATPWPPTGTGPATVDPALPPPMGGPAPSPPGHGASAWTGWSQPPVAQPGWYGQATPDHGSSAPPPPGYPSQGQQAPYAPAPGQPGSQTWGPGPAQPEYGLGPAAQGTPGSGFLRQHVNPQRARVAMIACAVLVVAGVLMPSGLSIALVSNVAWSLFAVAAGLVQLVPVFVRPAQQVQWWRIESYAVAAFSGYWLLVALPSVTGLSGFFMTLALAAAWLGLLLNPARQW